MASGTGSEYRQPAQLAENCWSAVTCDFGYGARCASSRPALRFPDPGLSGIRPVRLTVIA